MSASLEEMRKRIEAKRKQLEQQQQQQQAAVAQSDGVHEGAVEAKESSIKSTNTVALAGPMSGVDASSANGTDALPDSTVVGSTASPKPPTSAPPPPPQHEPALVTIAKAEEIIRSHEKANAAGVAEPAAESAVKRKRPRTPPQDFQSPPDAVLEYHSRDVMREPQTSAAVASRFMQSAAVKQVAQRLIHRIEEEKRSNDISWSRKKARSKADDAQRHRTTTTEGSGEDAALAASSCFVPAETKRRDSDETIVPVPPCRSVESFFPEGKLSEGVYGIVFRGRCAETGQVFALKQIKAQWLTESQIGFPGYLLREIDLTLNLVHPNIIRTREVVYRRDGVENRDKRQDRKRGALEELEMEAEEGFDDVLLLGEVATTTSNKSVPTAAPVPQGRRIGAGSANGVLAEENIGRLAVKPGGAAAVPPSSTPKPYGLSVYAVMEFAWRDLKNYLYERRTPFLHLSRRNVHPDAVTAYVARIKCIAKQIFTGLSFLHRHSILHRDLKTSNILVTSDGTAKICDLGLARFFRRREPLTPTVVTLMYRAPELHFGIHDYDAALDIWSAGCILAELFLKAPLFRAETEIEHCARVCRILGYPTNDSFRGVFQLRQAVEVLTEALDTPCAPIEGGSRSTPAGDDWSSHQRRLAECFYSEKASSYRGAKALTPMGLDLLERIFQWNPRDRPSADEVLAHPFFTQEMPLPADKSELTKPMPFATAQHQQQQTSGKVTESAAGSSGAVAVSAGSGALAALAVATTTAEDDARLELEDELEQEAQLEGVRDTSPPKAAARRRLLAVDDEASRVVSPTAQLVAES